MIIFYQNVGHYILEIYVVSEKKAWHWGKGAWRSAMLKQAWGNTTFISRHSTTAPAKPEDTFHPFSQFNKKYFENLAINFIAKNAADSSGD